MSQPDPELAISGEESIDDIAVGLDEGGEEVIEQGAPDPDEALPDDAPEQQDTPSDEDPDEEWESGGQTFRVKRSELRAGYMKDADYRRKTAEVAEQRRTVEQMGQAYQQKLHSAANQLDVHLASLHQALVGSQPKPELIESDPQEFLRQQADYQQRVAQYQTALQQRQAVQAHQDQEQQRMQQQFAREEGQRLLEAVPAWRDEKTRAAESAQIAEYLTGLGYTADEMNSLVDHRALLVARDAAKFRQLQAAKAKKDTTPPARPLRAGTAQGGADQSARALAARERYASNPDSLDALAGFADARGI